MFPCGILDEHYQIVTRRLCLHTLTRLACCCKDTCHALKTVELLRCNIIHTEECTCGELCLSRLLRCVQGTAVQRPMELCNRNDRDMQPRDERFEYFTFPDCGCSIWILEAPIDVFFSVRLNLQEFHPTSHFLTLGVFDTDNPSDIIAEIMETPSDHQFVYTSVEMQDSAQHVIGWYFPLGGFEATAVGPLELRQESTWTFCLSAWSVFLFCNRRLVSEAAHSAIAPWLGKRVLAISIWHSSCAPEIHPGAHRIRPQLLQVAVSHATFFSAAVKQMFANEDK